MPNYDPIPISLEYCKHLKGIPMDGPEEGDPVKQPKHYTQNPSGIECIEVSKHFNFCLGNVIKYIWRAGFKTESPLEDLRKARQYLDYEIERLEGK